LKRRRDNPWSRPYVAGICFCSLPENNIFLLQACLNVLTLVAEDLKRLDALCQQLMVDRKKQDKETMAKNMRSTKTTKGACRLKFDLQVTIFSLSMSL